MADRLGQEKDNKRSKTLLTVAVVLVVLNVLLFFLVPTQKNISYDEDAVIYSVSDEHYEKPCHVTLTGTLTQSVLLKDVFEGSLYITDVPGLEENMTIRLTRKQLLMKNLVEFRPAGEIKWKTIVSGGSADRNHTSC